MAEPTYMTATAVAVVRDIDPGFDPATLRKWRAQGWLPGDVEEGKAQYTRDELVSLRIMVELTRHHGASIERAYHIACSRPGRKGFDWPGAKDYRFLVFIDDAVHFVKASEIPDLFRLPHIKTGEPLTSLCSAIVVDAAKAAQVVDESLRELEEREAKP
jgi:hypothetical protein